MGQASISLGAVTASRFSPLQTVIGRAMICVPVTMAVWWFLLKPFSLWLLRILAWLPLAVLIAPPQLDPIRLNPDTHEWVFNVAVNTVVTNPQTGSRQHVASVEFVGAEENLASFACGWFCYLALAFSAAGFSRNHAKRILAGMGLQTAISILSLAAYAYINGYASVVNVPGSAQSTLWVYRYFYYLIYLVVPYAGPFGVALLVHQEWRAYFTAPTLNVEDTRVRRVTPPR